MQKFRLSIFLVIITSVSFAQTEWKLKKDADEIKIYTRSIPNEKLDEYKAVTTIKTSIENVLEELISAPKYYDQCESGISYHIKKVFQYLIKEG